VPPLRSREIMRSRSRQICISACSSTHGLSSHLQLGEHADLCTELCQSLPIRCDQRGASSQLYSKHTSTQRYAMDLGCRLEDGATEGHCRANCVGRPRARVVALTGVARLFVSSDGHGYLGVARCHLFRVLLREPRQQHARRLHHNLVASGRTRAATPPDTDDPVSLGPREATEYE